MDKNAIKKYAIWARRELIARVSQRAALYEITSEGFGDADAVSVHGRILSQEEKNQRRALIEKIKEKGYEQVMEEVAYTWFNRFSALRFMEVNGYLPSHVRVFTDDENNFKPQIMTEAINLEMDGLDMQKIYEFKTANDDDGLFKYLIITQCNALSDILPGMFQQISDYTELLFPDNLLREGSVVELMISMIPEEDWTDQVQIIGWLYQYYNTEPKAQVFGRKSGTKIKKEEVPAATQLFTPDWIVRYMVENSLGRLWIKGHPNDELKTTWKYYLEEAEQEDSVKKQLEEIRKEYSSLKPEDIRCIDPCMGSGHILVYMFDVLVQIYEAYGYSEREAAASIVENNIWGLDIDERASQLAYFSIMMKARQYDRSFLTRGIQPHVYAIHEANLLNEFYKQDTCDDLLFKENQDILNYLLEVFVDAKEYGSILLIEPHDYDNLKKSLNKTLVSSTVSRNLSLWQETVAPEIMSLIEQAVVLSKKYHVVVTNPPYMGGSGMDTKLYNYVKKYYPNSKNDLFAVFIERCERLVKNAGFQSMVTQHTWMFLSSYSKLRDKIRQMATINMLHLGSRAFEEISGEVVQTTSFVLQNGINNRYVGTYCRLTMPTTQQGKEKMFLSGKNRYVTEQSIFSKIPGAPVAYWLSKIAVSNFEKGKLLEDIAEIRQGLATSDNNKYLRLWYEVDIRKIDFKAKNCDNAKQRGYKWFPFNKGGLFRKWYGNQEYVVDYYNDGLDMKKNVLKKYPYLKTPDFVVKNSSYYFLPSITWTEISFANFGVRYSPPHAIFSNKSNSIFPKSELDTWYLLSLLCSKPANMYITAINPTISKNVGDVAKIPILFNWEKFGNAEQIVKQNISIEKEDWDSFETSWNFTRFPLTNDAYISRAYANWKNLCDCRFSIIKNNEENLNRRFIEIYGLQEDLTPDIDNEDVTLRNADLHRDIRGLVSYAVGCMFGRYSLDQPGLILAGQDFKEKFVYSNVPLSGTGFSGMPSLVSGKRVCYLKRGDNDFVRCTFEPDEDAIIPICDDEYFNDDIVSRFVEFVEVVYGKETIEENLQFIADALGGSGTSREIIRNYFNNGFYADHLKVYQKRPIYWLFDSGKKNGFKCLVYMHRYKPDTIARIRTDYVHEQQSRYRTSIADLQTRIDNAATTSERVKLSKKLKTVQEQDEELRIYEEKIHHLADQMIKIDLDDGVKVNYEKFQDVLAKIK